MKTDDIRLLKLLPAIASVVVNVVVLIFFFWHFGSLQSFFKAARAVEGNFAVMTVMLLVAVIAGTVFCSLSIVLIGARKSRPGGQYQ